MDSAISNCQRWYNGIAGRDFGFDASSRSISCSEVPRQKRMGYLMIPI